MPERTAAATTVMTHSLRGSNPALPNRSTDDAWVGRTVWELVQANQKSRPNKDALVAFDTLGAVRRVTFAELAKRSADASAAFVSIGVRRGDRIALWMTNLTEWVFAFLGALRIGAIVVPISTRLKADEVTYFLHKSGARHLLMLDHFRKIDFEDILTQMIPEWKASPRGQLSEQGLPELRNVVIFGRSGRAPSGAAYDWEELVSTAETYRDLTSEIARAVRPLDVAVIKFTSGSTALPKGVMLEQWGLVTNALLHSRRLGVTDQDVWFSMMPFFHAGGSVWGLLTMISRGGTLVFTEASDGELAARVIEDEHCTVVFGVPAMMRDICLAAERQARRYRTVRLANFEDPSLLNRMRSALSPRALFTPYGMTEVYGPASVTSNDDGVERQEGMWSRPLDGQELRIVDPHTGRDAIPGRAGEIWMRGLVMRGYFDMPEQTANMIDREGWIHSQDLGVMDEAGYVRYVGRIKAMLKVGGENVAVEEVENTIRSFPGVSDVAVIGITDERKGEVPRAYLVMEPNASLVVEELISWCSERLASFKVPRDCVTVPLLPRTGSGKVDRAALIKQDRDASGVESVQA